MPKDRTFAPYKQVAIAYRQFDKRVWTYHYSRARYFRTPEQIATEYASNLGAGFVICVGVNDRFTYLSFKHDNGIAYVEKYRKIKTFPIIS